ncbi:hypothetical protein DL93DRAFT_2059620 [Clavulina sp. PMI_390]|nr:hypothetical protein DL93DRAFT_2059620 [Clavulina sp. PMI_390]
MNPFDTHKVFKRLEQDFPSPIAHTIMRATRGLLIDRIHKARRDGVDIKEAENQEYLYRAALSELRTELSMRTKNESAALSQSASLIRKDVEALSAKMKEDIATMKHEMQMELNNRRNEVKGDHKMTNIAIEELVHEATVKISDLKTEVEQGKWDNTRRGVAVIGVFVLVVILALETAKPSSFSRKSKSKVEESDANDGKDTEPKEHHPHVHHDAFVPSNPPSSGPSAVVPAPPAARH